MYTRCSYVYPSGNQCSNPIPRHLDPPLCGGHCDSVDPPKLEPSGDSSSASSEKELLHGHEKEEVAMKENKNVVDGDRSTSTDHT